MELIKRNLKCENDINKKLRNKIQDLMRVKDEVCNDNGKCKQLYHEVLSRVQNLNQRLE